MITDSFQWRHAKNAYCHNLNDSQCIGNAWTHPCPTHVKRNGSVTQQEWNHAGKNLRNLPNFTLKKNKQGKQKLHFWSFSRVYKGRGINSCFHDSHTHSAAMEEASFLLGFILMLQAPFHWNITYSLCYPSALLHPLLSFLCSTFNSYPSFLPLAECATQSSLCLAPKLPPDKTFPLERTTGRGEEGKKRGERAVCLSNRNTDTELRTESSGMPK